MNISKEIKTDNQFNFSGFYKQIVEENPNFLKFVEIGVYKGHSLTFLAGKLINRKGAEVLAVDLWDETYIWDDDFSKLPEKYKKYKQNIKPHLFDIYKKHLEIKGLDKFVQTIKGYSHEVAEQFEDNIFDFIFIDADHRYEQVKKDINAWLPKLKKCGIIAGHDYGNAGTGVKKAVDEIFPVTGHFKNVWYLKID